MPVRVLIVSTYFPPHVGGVEVVVEHQARTLAQAGHEVVVATSRSEGAAPGRETRDGFEVWRLPASNAIERRSGIPYPVVGPAFMATLSRLVRQCDVVHVHDVLYQPPQLGALLAQRLRRPLYVTQHVGPVNHDHPLVRGVERAVARVAGRPLLRRAERVVSYNPMVFEHLLRNGVPAERICSSTIGVDLTHFRPGPEAAQRAVRASLGLPPDQPLVLFVGRLVHKKGYHKLIEAAGDEYHIVLAGSGSPGEPLPDGVTAIGPQNRERLAQLYRMADVFVLPSTGEIFPIVAQEALACGLPVVMTDDPRYDAYRVDRALLRLTPSEPAALRSAVLDILHQPGLRQAMSRYSRRLAEELFDAEAGRKAITGLYDREGARCTSPLSS